MVKRKDGLWQEQIKLPGMKKPKYFYGKTQKEVKKKMAAWQQEQADGEHFERVADAWAVWHEAQVSYNASEAYNAALRRAKEHFKGRHMESIGADEIDAYIRLQAGRGYARRTVQLHLDMLNMIFNYAIVNRLAAVNPCVAVKLPGGLPKTKREIPTDDQLQKVKEGVSLEFGLFPFMLLYTGLRRGELLALRWEDIDRKSKVIHINKSVYFVGNTPQIKLPKTEAGRRDVVLLDILDQHLPWGKRGYVFGGENPLTKSMVRKRWLSWCKAAGLASKDDRGEWKQDITPHQLRHAFATILFDAGIDEKDAQDILGHASIQVTRDIYTHVRQSRRESTANKLNLYVFGEEKNENAVEVM